MFKSFYFFILISFVFLLSCGVEKKEVEDRPPQFLRTNSFDGEVFGHIPVYNDKKGKYGNSFSALLFPDAQTAGDQFGKNNYGRSVVDRLRFATKVIEPITQVQLIETLVSQYKTQCKLKPPTIDPVDFQFDCSRLYQMPVVKPDFKPCGLSLTEVEDEISDKQCECVGSNNELVKTTYEQMNLHPSIKFKAKKAYAECAWEAIEPYEDRSEHWLLGDNKKRDGSPDGDGENGSRLSIVSDGKGGARVILDLINFDGVHYSTEPREPQDKWGEIVKANYDTAKAILTFSIVEENQQKQKTGREFRFKMTRTQPFKFAKGFHRFNGDFKIYQNNEIVSGVSGTAKFDGYLESDKVFDEEKLIDFWEDIVLKEKR